MLVPAGDLVCVVGWGREMSPVSSFVLGGVSKRPLSLQTGSEMSKLLLLYIPQVFFRLLLLCSVLAICLFKGLDSASSGPPGSPRAVPADF